jgi:hypothetical protein
MGLPQVRFERKAVPAFQYMHTQTPQEDVYDAEYIDQRAYQTHRSHHPQCGGSCDLGSLTAPSRDLQPAAIGQYLPARGASRVTDLSEPEILCARQGCYHDHSSDVRRYQSNATRLLVP